MLSALLIASVFLTVSVDYQLDGQKVRVDSVASGFDVIWAFEFLSADEILVNERGGQMSRYSLKSKKKTPVRGVPPVVARGQGGLLDLKLHPNFKKNKWVYFSYSHGEKDKQTTRISRAKLEGNSLKELQVLFTATPYYPETRHYGSRIAFGPKGYLFFSVGDRGNRDYAQSLDRDNGKIMRLHDDGRVPKDNPFKKKAIWSWGHRNPQGLQVHPATGELWSHEHGPRGGDELNLVKKNKNYGWPLITYGREYSGLPVGNGKSKKAGMEQPVYHYAPSIAPSGFLIYNGKAFPKWKGHFFLGALALMHLNHLTMKAKQVVKEERYLKELAERIRAIREGPGGYIYFSTDSGRIYRVRPT